jgi:deoxycytidylate deaminase
MSQRPELVIGFVAPAGVRLRDLVNRTGQFLRDFKYNPIEIRLSELLRRSTHWKAASSDSEDVRILHGQRMGHEFRERLGDPAALVVAALVSIREVRAKLSDDPDKPADAVAYLLNQLKHPSEVKLLRQIYGPSFVLIAAHATKGTRRDNLVSSIASSESRGTMDDDIAKALNIIRIDDEESGRLGTDELGQNTRSTYPLADMFVNLERHPSGEFAVGRFIDLLFGHPFHTPRPDEVAMYHASAAALRSSDESRQVGAVIVNVRRDSSNEQTSNVEVIATGMNEVPMRGGGFYWDGSTNSPDARDQWLVAYLNDDRALTVKKDVLRELLEIFKREKWFDASIASKQTPELLRQLIPDGLKGTQFLNIGEFQRQVHAEMAALVDSARRGVAVDGRTMFVTTFPCHNCAKHIIAAGIRHVVYLEPYPKSRAEMLHKEEIELDSMSGSPGDESQNGGGTLPVVFSPYAGIAPRQFQRLFSMSGRGRKVLFALKEWDTKKATVAPQHLIRNAFASYLMAERQELARLRTDVFKWDPGIVCPTQQ